jgi:oxaloacetate decarboxylase alpha subunit
MSMTYSHSATESLVSIFAGTDKDSGLDITKLEEIAAYFRTVRKKYAKFEGALKGIDSRILVAQVPGGMLTNLEGQLKEQGATDRLDEVLKEIPAVRKDLGYIPLVTPTSQIVGTQAVINVLSGERYKSITKETAGLLRGEYGATAAPVDEALQQRVLKDGGKVITCRPADLIEPEMDKLTNEFRKLVKEQDLQVSENEIDDVLIYAQFPQVGLNFIKNRNNPAAFEPVPGSEPAPAAAAPAPAASAPASGPEQYQVTVNGTQYDVVVSAGGEVSQVNTSAAAPAAAAPAPASDAEDIVAPMAGTVIDILVNAGDSVDENEPVIIIEAMKMETEIRAVRAGTIQAIHVNKGDAIQVNQPLLSLA